MKPGPGNDFDGQVIRRHWEDSVRLISAPDALRKLFSLEQG